MYSLTQAPQLLLAMRASNLVKRLATKYRLHTFYSFASHHLKVGKYKYFFRQSCNSSLKIYLFQNNFVIGLLEYIFI